MGHFLGCLFCPILFVPHFFGTNKMGQNPCQMKKENVINDLQEFQGLSQKELAGFF